MPLAAARASKACDTCRRLKTRCYTTEDSATCLRCQTQRQSCSLDEQPLRTKRRRLEDSSDATSSVDSRLERLESLMTNLIERLDPKPSTASSQASVSSQKDVAPEASRSQAVQHDQDDTAPILMLRDAAQTIGVLSPQETFSMDANVDIVTNGSITMREALELVKIFQRHYARWVRFDENVPAVHMLSQISRSPLLLSSVCLIAVRHTTQELAERLAPEFFDEARRLLQRSLLVAPQSLEFFQATLILSLWSTTIGRAPLSLDSWLLTGFALQHGQISPCFESIALGAEHERAPRNDAAFIWNHTCLAHLQYCIGTRRNALINEHQVERCASVLDDTSTNFETRMVAELKLYWLMYVHCSGACPDISVVKTHLETWKEEWSALFEQPRSQFLQMSHQFALLLAYCRWLRSPSATVRRPALAEMLLLARGIVELAMNTADQRTRHLTDHIYHMISFSAITICRLLHKYEAKVANASELDALVAQLIKWLRSVGLSCHAASVLGGIVAAQQVKLRSLTSNGQDAVLDTQDVAASQAPRDQEEANPPPTWETFLNWDWAHPYDIDLDFDALAWPTWPEADALSASDV